MNLRRWQGAAEQVALGLITALFAQELQLGRGFHAFRCGLHAQCLCHADDGAHDSAIVAVMVQVVHERLVDLGEPLKTSALSQLRRAACSKFRT